MVTKLIASTFVKAESVSDLFTNQFCGDLLNILLCKKYNFNQNSNCEVCDKCQPSLFCDMFNL